MLLAQPSELKSKTSVMKLLTHFNKHSVLPSVFFVTFTDKVREANGCVLIHCLAGISRSPTVAIAYIMHIFGMTSEEAYRSVFT